MFNDAIKLNVVTNESDNQIISSDAFDPNKSV